MRKFTSPKRIGANSSNSFVQAEVLKVKQINAWV